MIRSALRPAIRAAVRPVLNQHLRGGDVRADLIAELFGGSETGVYIANPSSYYTDTSRTTASSIGNTPAGIEDLSGSGHHFEQANSSLQALHQSDGLLSDGLDDEYSHSGDVLGALSNPFACFACADFQTAPGDSVNKIIMGGAGFDDWGFYVRDGLIRMFLRTTNGSLMLAEGTTDLRASGMAVLSARYDPSSPEIVVRVNGTQEGSDSSGDSNRRQAAPSTNLLSLGGASYWEGLVGECVVTSGRLLTDSEMLSAEQKVASLCGLSI